MAVAFTRVGDTLGVFEPLSKILSKLNKRGFEMSFSSHPSGEVAWGRQESFIACLVDKSDRQKMIAVQWNIDPIAHVKDTKMLCKRLVGGMRKFNYDDDNDDDDDDVRDTDDFLDVRAFVLCDRSTKLARKAAFEISAELDFFNSITFCNANQMFAKIA